MAGERPLVEKMMPAEHVRRPGAPPFWRLTPSSWLAIALTLALPCLVHAQPQGGQGGPGGGRGAATPRAAAPVDLTGYWVSIVTEDWIERMSPESPPSGVIGGGRGGFGGGRGGGRGGAPPITSSDPCAAYGAAGSMRVPTRLNITWQDDNTLKIEMDAGSQARLLHFDAAQAPPAERSLQGYSVANWDTGGGRGRGRGGRGGRGGAPAGPTWGSLNVVTTNMTAGYLLSSRAYYSENAVLTEHVMPHSDFGQDYFTVAAIVEDGGQRRIASSTFKKEPDGSKFNPRGCELKPNP